MSFMATNNPTFPVLRFPILEQVPLPPVQRVRLSHPQADPVADLQASVVSALEQSARFRQLPAGSQVAVAVGSRGIARRGARRRGGRWDGAAGCRRCDPCCRPRRPRRRIVARGP